MCPDTLGLSMEVWGAKLDSYTGIASSLLMEPLPHLPVRESFISSQFTNQFFFSNAMKTSFVSNSYVKNPYLPQDDFSKYNFFFCKQNHNELENARVD